MTDRIDEAIASSSSSATVELVEIPIQISSTGRAVLLAIPRDLAGDELLDLIAWLASPAGLTAYLARIQRPPTLVVPGLVVPS